MFRWLQRVLYGRYGGDAFSVFLLVTGVVFSLLAGLFFRPLYLVADLLYLVCFLRAFSRNHEARRRENQAFLRLWEPVAGWFSRVRAWFRNHRQYKYFRCPNCKQRLRAPRGRGQIEVTCQRCRHVFRTRT